MREVMEHYGAAILSVISAIAILGIWITLFGRSGILSGIVIAYMNSLGG